MIEGDNSPIGGGNLTQSQRTDSALLRTESLTKRFGELTAVDNVDYTINHGELASIIGPNGAGKTTLFNLITGEYSPTTGRIYVEDEDITGLKPHQRVQKGFGRVFQITNLFPDLSTFENIRLAVQAAKVDRSGLLRNPDSNDEVLSRTDELLSVLDLGEARDLAAKNLSHGNKRRLEIGMALALEPRLLLLDEPMAGLTENEINEISDFILDIADQFTILLVEHKMDVVMELSDRISVLHRGQLIAEGTVEDIRTDERVQEVYLGEEEV